MATMLMSSHHAFRRDMARFINAIQQMQAGDVSRQKAVQEEWNNYRNALHGHHTVEDQHMFPDIAKTHPDHAAAIAILTEQHHRIDPLIERGDAAFANLQQPQEAANVLAELKALLDEHLAFEEAQVTLLLRNAKEFPAPPNEEALAMYADGFAWSLHGLAPHVAEQMKNMLPTGVRERLPAAQQAFADRCTRIWGAYTEGAATTPIPDGYHTVASEQ